MNALIQLLVCHLLAGCGAFFAANGIDGSSTTGILVGVAMLALGVAISAVSKWFKLAPVNLTGNVLLRQFLGAVISQGITALSAYLATDANNPELLAVAAINMGASKLGAHQKLVFLGTKNALKICVLSLSLLSLTSCAELRSLVLSNRAVIEETIVYGVRTGVKHGFEKLDAKQPREVVPEGETKK